MTREKLQKFINSNLISAMLFIGVILIFFPANPIVGIIIYGISIHFLVIILICGIYSDPFFDGVFKQVKEERVKINKFRRILNNILNPGMMSLFVILLLLEKRWYLTIVTIIATLLLYFLCKVARDKIKEES